MARFGRRQPHAPIILRQTLTLVPSPPVGRTVQVNASMAVGLFARRPRGSVRVGIFQGQAIHPKPVGRVVQVNASAHAAVLARVRPKGKIIRGLLQSLALPPASAVARIVRPRGQLAALQQAIQTFQPKIFIPLWRKFPAPPPVPLPHPQLPPGVGQPLLPRDPLPRDMRNARMSRFTELLSEITNSLLRRGFLRRVASGTWMVQSAAFELNRAPLPLDDSSFGVIPGSLWLDTLGQDAYICIDNTASHAVWKKLT